MRSFIKRKRIAKGIISVFLSLSMVISTGLLPGMPAAGQNVYADSSISLPFIVNRTDYGVQDKDVSAVRVTIKPDSNAYFMGYESGGEDLNTSGPMIICQKESGSRCAYYLLGPSGEIVYTWVTSSESEHPEAIMEVNADSYSDQNCVDHNRMGENPLSDTIYSIKDPNTGKLDIYNASTGMFYTCQADRIWRYSDNEDYPSLQFLYFEKSGEKGLLSLQGEPLCEGETFDTFDGLTYFDNKLFAKVWRDKKQKVVALDGSYTSDFYKTVSIPKFENIGYSKEFSNSEDNICDRYVIMESDDGREKVYNLETGEFLADGDDFGSVSYAGKGVFVGGDYNDSTEDNLATVFTDSTTIQLNNKYGYDSVTASGMHGYVEAYMEDKDDSLYIVIDGNGNLVHDGHANGIKGNLVAYDEKIDDNTYRSRVKNFKNGQDISLGEGTTIYYTVNTRYTLLVGNIYGTEADIKWAWADPETGSLIAERCTDTWKYHCDEPGYGGILVKNNEGKAGIIDEHTGSFTGFSDDLNYDYVKDYSWIYDDNGKILYYISVENEGDYICDSNLKKIKTLESDSLYGVNDYRNFILRSDYDGLQFMDASGTLSQKYFTDSYLHMGALFRIPVKESKNGNYGILTRDGSKILECNYGYTPRSRNGVSFVGLDDGYSIIRECGVVAADGKWLIKGKYVVSDGYAHRGYAASCADQITVLRANGTEYNEYLIYDLRKAVARGKGADADGELAVTETYPANGATGVQITENRDISITFNKNVNIFNDIPVAQVGTFKIRDYQTGAVVLSYDMLKGSAVGKVTYQGKNHKKILLKNALTALDKNKKYFVTMSNRCVTEEGKSSNWFEGFSDNNTFNFTTGSESFPETDLTYLAACAFGEFGGLKAQSSRVEEFTSTGKFKDRTIWSDQYETYSMFVNRLIGNYKVDSVKAPSLLSAGYILLKNEKNNRYIAVVMFSGLPENQLESVYTESFSILSNGLKGLANDKLVVTGIGAAGMLAAYYGTVTDTTAVTFNAPVDHGIDMALAYNPGTILDYQGRAALNIKNYSCKLLSFLSSTESHQLDLKFNPHGNSWGINALFQADNGVFSLMPAEHEYFAGEKGITVTPLSLEEYYSILKKMLPTEGVIKYIKGLYDAAETIGTEVYSGGRLDDPYIPESFGRALCVYSGGSRDKGDDLQGSRKFNQFNLNGGKAICYGGACQDIYYINGKSGEYTIKDKGVLSKEIELSEKILKFIDGLANIDISSVLGAYDEALAVKKVYNTIINGEYLDCIVFNNSEVSDSQVESLGDGKYAIYSTDRNTKVIVNSEITTRIRVVGLNDTETEIPSVIMGDSSSGKRMVKAARASSAKTDSAVLLNQFTIKGDNIQFEMYSGGELLAGGTAVDENLDAACYYAYQAEADTWVFCMSDIVDEFRITGGNAGKLETSVSEDEIMTFDINGGIASVLCNEGIVRDAKGEEITGDLITVESEKTLSSLTIIPPEKSDYVIGEPLDLTGIEVQAYYSDGNCRVLNESEFSVSGFDSDSAGEKEITVSYSDGEETAVNSFSIIVHSKEELAETIDVNGDVNVVVGSAKELDIRTSPMDYDQEALIITSSDESVASVNGTWIVGISAGTAVINIIDPLGRISASCQVTVEAASSSETIYWINTMLDGLGDSVSEEDRDMVIAIREAVGNLDEDMQYKVDIDKLEAAEKELGIDTGDPDDPYVPDDPDDPYVPVDPSGDGEIDDAAARAAAREKAAEEEFKGKLNTKFPVVKITKAKAAKKSITVQWKKLSNKKKKLITNIEVQYSLKKSFPRKETTVKKINKKKSSLKIKKLTSKKIYYVRIRTIKYVNGVKNVSKWSKVKKVKVK